MVEVPIITYGSIYIVLKFGLYFKKTLRIKNSFKDMRVRDIVSKV